MKTQGKRFSPEVRERAVGMVFDPCGGHATQWAAIHSIAGQIGCNAETLRLGVRRSERDAGLRAGPASDGQARIEALERGPGAAPGQRNPAQGGGVFRGGGARKVIKSCASSPDRFVGPGLDPGSSRGPRGEPICKVAPRRDAVLKIAIERVFTENFRVYGVRKIWRQLRREGVAVAHRTVGRLMKALGLRGAIRGKPIRTTISAKAAACPLDRANRSFLPCAEPTAGLGLNLRPDVERLRLCRLRDRRLCPSHRRLARQPQRPCRRRTTEWLKDAGREPSVGSVGDSYDNALAETINDLSKTEVIPAALKIDSSISRDYGALRDIG